jgi:hypothetical protein
MEDENLVYVGDNILSVEQATLFRFSSAKSLLSSTPKQVITENPELKDNASISSEFARYGEDNTYPNRIAKLSKAITPSKVLFQSVVLPFLDRVSKQLFGRMISPENLLITSLFVISYVRITALVKISTN